jgi:hypothetical protein
MTTDNLATFRWALGKKTRQLHHNRRIEKNCWWLMMITASV